MYALLLADDGRILSIMDERYRTENTPLVDSYPAERVCDYRYIDNEWIFDPVPKEKDEANIQDVVNSFLLGEMAMNRLQAAEQFRKALQMFAASLDDEKAMEVAAVFDSWVVGKYYAVGDFLTYGVNAVGDPQLYKVAQAHTAQADWKPDVTPALYTAIGLDASGYPVWSQPTGSHDAYNTGDIVNFNGTLYQSLIDGNVYSPDAYPDGWKVYTES